MKKTVGMFFVLTIAFSMTATANDYCQARQKLEARIAFAKEMKLNTDEVKVKRYIPGSWTKMTENNTGSDRVEVETPFGDTLTIGRLYEVSARQLGTSPDCQILAINAVWPK